MKQKWFCKLVSLLLVCAHLLSLGAPAASAVAYSIDSTDSGETVVAETAERYYRKQLTTADSREIYDLLVTLLNDGSLQSGTYTVDLVAKGILENMSYEQAALMADFTAARDAFALDYNVFYVDFSKLTITQTQVEGGYRITLGIGRDSTYFREGFTTANVADAVTAYNDAADAIAEAALKETDLEAQVKAAYQGVMANNTYALEDAAEAENVPYVRTPYGALVKGQSVCEGYARALKEVLDRMGIESVLVQGTYDNDGTPEPHMWNYVHMDDNRWYLVDATMGDGHSANATDHTDAFLLKTVLDEDIVRYYVADGTITPSTYAKEFRYPSLATSAYQKLTDAFTSETVDGEARVSYQGMGVAKTAEETGLNILVSFTGEKWYYLDTYHAWFCADIPAYALQDYEAYFVNLMGFSFFAVTPDALPTEVTQDSYNYTGTNIHYKSQLGEAVELVKVAPYVVSSVLTQGDTVVSPAAIRGGQSYTVTVTYSEELSLTNAAQTGTVVGTTEAAKNGLVADSFTWDGQKTVSFQVQTASTYEFNVSYCFALSGFLGAESLMQPRGVGFSVVNKPTFACPKLAGSISTAYASTPALIADDDLFANAFASEDGVVPSELTGGDLTNKLSLVATAIEAPAETPVSGTSQTYDITLGLCGNQIDFVEGKGLKVYVPFPAGITAPEGYAFKAYHYNESTETFEEVSCVATEKGLILFCNAFSPYTVVAMDAAEVSEKTLLISAENGSADPSGLVTVKEGESVTVTLTPVGGYALSQVLLDGAEVTVTDNTVTLTYDQLQTGGSILEAEFVTISLTQAAVGEDGEMTTPTYAAAIGGTGYATLKQAVTGAQAGETVTLLADVEVSSLDIDKAMTLDLNGYTITGSDIIRTICVNPGADATVIIQDSSPAQTGSVAGTSSFMVEQLSGKLVVKGGTYSGTNSSGASTPLSGVDNIETVIDGGTFLGEVSVGQNMTINGGTFINGNGRAIGCAGVNPELLPVCNLTIHGGTFTASREAIYGANANIVIDGGTFNGDTILAYSSGTVSIDGGTFNAVSGIFGAYVEGTINITGGDFSHDPSGYMPEGYQYQYKNDRYYVGTFDFLIGDVSYDTLVEALEAAQPGDTILLCDDLTLTSGVTIDKDITLDLDYRTLSIPENGEGLTIAQGAEVTIQDSAYGTISGGSYAIRNLGTLNLKSGYLSGDTAIINGDGETAAVLNIHGGTISSGDTAAIENRAGATTNIHDGLVEWVMSSSGGAVARSLANAETTQSDTAAAVINRGTLNISGGTVNGGITNDGGTVGIVGGQFNEDPSALLADEYMAVKSGNGGFTIAPVAAMIVETGAKFASLQDAVSEAEEGNTVKLVSDVAEGVGISTGITLDLNGHTITDSGNYTVEIDGAAEVTIRDSSAAKTGEIVGMTASVCIMNTNAHLFVEGGTITGTDFYGIDNNGTLTIAGGNITGLFSGVWTDGTTLISGGTITGTQGAGVENQGTLTVENGTISGQFWGIFAGTTYNAVVNTIITGGTISGTGTEPVEGITFHAIQLDEGTTYTITGGSFSHDPSQYLAEGYVAWKENDRYEVVNDVAQVNGIGYDTLAEAHAAAKDGDTITVLQNINLSANFEITKAITLDLNGKAITLASGSVQSNCATGVVTITDTSEGKTGIVKASTTALRALTDMTVVYAQTDAKYGIYVPDNAKDPTVIVYDGIFKGTDNGLQARCGSLVIKGGTFTGEGAWGLMCSSNLTIEGGSFTGGTYGISVGGVSTSERTVVINGGEYTGKTAGARFSVYLNPTINGGTFNGTEDAAVRTGGTVTITGGTFNGNSKNFHTENDTATFVVSGGNFSHDVNTYCAEGYLAEEQDGRWVVRKANYVAQIVDGGKYESLQAAVDAAPTGGKVKLLQNVDNRVTITKALTLDLNGKSVTQASAVSIETTGQVYIVDTSAEKTGSINGSASAIYNQSTENVKVTVKGVTLKAKTWGVYSAKKATIVLEDCTVEAGKIAYVFTSNGQVSITGGNYTVTKTDETDETELNFGSSPVSITGGTFNMDPSAYVAEDYRAYDNGDGTFTVRAIPYVAEIVDGGKYETLEAAVAAATAGQTVKLLADANVGEYLDVGMLKTLTLDLNGKSITGTEYGIRNDGNLTVTGEGTITGYYDGIWNRLGTLTVNGGTITGESSNGIYTTGVLTVNGGTITGASNGIWGQLNDVQITVTGGTITGTSNRGIYAQVPLAIEGGTITGGHYGIDSTKNLTLTGGTIISNGEKVIYLEGTYSLTGGTFSHDPSVYVAEGYLAEEQDGRWVVRKANYVAEVDGTKYESLQDAVYEAEGKTVKLLQNINTDYTVEIANTITLELNGMTISVFDNSAIYVAGSGKVTIQDAVGTGKIENTCFNSVAVTNAGELNITGGTFTGTSAALKCNSGTISITGGTFSHDVNAYCAEGYLAEEQDGHWIVRKANYVAEVDGSKYESLQAAVDAADGKTVKLLADVEVNAAVSVSSDDSITLDLNGHNITSSDVGIRNNGTLTLTGSGTITSNGTYTAGIVNHGTAAITGGTICGNYEGISNYGTLTIEGGSISGGEDGITAEEGTVIIRGGIIAGGEGYGVWTKDGNVTIQGGTINGSVHVNSMYNGTISITGGTFSHDPSVYVAEGYEAVQDGERWVVQEAKVYVAEVNGIKYDLLFKAYYAANSGDTIKLLANISNTGGLEIKKNLTLDLNGFNVTFAEGAYGFNVYCDAANDYAPYDVTIKNGTLQGTPSTRLIESSGNLKLDNVQISVTGAGIALLVAHGTTTLCNGTTVTGDKSYALGIDVLNEVAKPAVVVEDAAIHGAIALASAQETSANLTLTIGEQANVENAALEALGDLSNANITKAATIELTAPEGYHWENDTRLVKTPEVTHVAEVNGIGYETIAAAFAAAKDGETVKLLADCTAGETIKVAKSITLDLNGKSLSTAESFSGLDLFTVTGHLTVKGEGSIYSACDAMFNGNVTIEGSGTYTGKWTVFYAGENAVVAINGGTYASENAAVLSVEDTASVTKTAEVQVDTPEGYQWKNGTTLVKSAAAYIGSIGYETLADAIAAAGEGDTITLSDGTHTMPTSVANKNITITGSKLAVIEVYNPVNASGSTVNFDGVTVKFDNDNYEGFQHAAKVTYSGCAIYGKQFLYAPTVEFTNCVIENKDDYSVWTYGATDVKFTGCTFNSGGKAILVYNEQMTGFVADIALSGCVFNDDDTLDTKKAAVELGINIQDEVRSNNVYHIAFTGCTVNGFAVNDEGISTESTFWGNKNSMTNDNGSSVTIDGSENLMPAGKTYVAQIGETKYETLAEAFTAANVAGGTVKLLADVELAETITVTNTVILELNGHTIQSTITTKDSYLFVINGGALTVNDENNEGHVAAADNYKSLNLRVFNVKNGELTINGGSYVGRNVIFAENVDKAVVRVTGGILTNADLATICGPNQKALTDCVITGGTYVKWDPDANDYVPETHTTTTTEDETGNTVYTVVKVEEPELTVTFAGTTLDVGNSLDINFYITKATVDADLMAADGYYVLITRSYADGTADDVMKILSSAWENHNYGYGVTYNKIAGAQMCDTMTVQVFYADGTPASEVKTDGVREYVMRNFDKQDDKVKSLFADMLNYGAAAQNFFDYNENDLANSRMTDAQKAYATASVTMTDSRVSHDLYAGSTLNLKSRIEMAVYFKNITAQMAATMYAKYSFTDIQGETVEVNVPAGELKHYSGNIWGVVLDELAVANAGQLVEVTVYNADGSVYAAATDSVESYIARMSNADVLYEAIMKFAASAKAYFLK